MAHFAKIENGIVVAVNVTCDDDETTYAEKMAEVGETWVQTSYNNRIRFNFAGIGYTYDPIDDAFIAPMPECGHDELLLNDLKRWECETCEAAPKQISDPA